MSQPAPNLDVRNVYAAFQCLTQTYEHLAAITTAAAGIDTASIGSLGPEYNDNRPVPEHVAEIAALTTAASNAAVAALNLIERAQDHLLMEIPGALVAVMGAD